MAQPTSQSDKPRRPRRSPEQKIADLQAEIDAERERIDVAVRSLASSALPSMKAIAETKANIPDNIRVQCEGTFAVLSKWLSSAKPGEGK